MHYNAAFISLKINCILSSFLLQDRNTNEHLNDRAQFRPLDFHDIAAYDALGFDIKLGEPAEDRCAGLCQSLAHGAAQLAFATNWWAMANGYRPRKVEPPSASALAPSLLLPGRDVTAQTTLRLARARIEACLGPCAGSRRETRFAARRPPVGL